jgi:hypothetical protein
VITASSTSTAAEVVRAVAAGSAFDDEARSIVQGALDRSARQASASIKALLPGKAIFHPRLDVDSLGFYVEHVVPRSVEILAHASGHTTIRTGNVWFDFRGRPPAFAWMDKHRFDGVDVALLQLLLTLHPAEGLPPLVPRAFGFSVIYFVDDAEVRSLERVFQAQPDTLPWEATGERGDTCLSLATGVLQQHLPSLRVTRCPGADFFVDAFSSASSAAVIGFYAPNALSLFDFVADVIAREASVEGRIRALLSFVPPPLQPALDAAIRGTPGNTVPAFNAAEKALVPPLPPWALAGHAAAFLLRHWRARQQHS